MADSSNTKKQNIITANFDSFENYNNSMDAMRCYSQNAGVEDLWEGSDEAIIRVIEDRYDSNNEVYDPITGNFDRNASMELYLANQEKRN